MLGPIPRRRLYQDISARLLESIKSGEYPPGAQLPGERELMQTFEVGRPAVREALQTLEQMGLLSISHGEKARVVRPSELDVVDRLAASVSFLIASSPSTLEHLKEARLLFETAMASRAASARNEEQLIAIRAALQAQKQATADAPEFLKRDRDFHSAIAAASNNPIFVAAARGMFDWLSEYHVAQVYSPGHEPVTLLEHESILKAIEEGDATRAAGAMKSHLERASSLYLSPQKAVD